MTDPAKLTRFDQIALLHLRQHYDASNSHPTIPEADWKSGQLARSQHSAIPRVIWIRMGGTLAPPASQGPLYGDNGTWITPLFADRAAAEVHIHGRDGAETENIWDGVLKAVKSMCGDQAEYGPYVWRTQEDDGAANIFAGAEWVIQRLVLPLIVPKDWGTSTIITAERHKAQIGLTEIDHDHH